MWPVDLLLPICCSVKNAVNMFPFSFDKPRKKSGKLAQIKKMKAKLAKLAKKEAVNREMERLKKALAKKTGF